MIQSSLQQRHSHMFDQAVRFAKEAQTERHINRKDQLKYINLSIRKTNNSSGPPGHYGSRSTCFNVVNQAINLPNENASEMLADAGENDKAHISMELRENIRKRKMWYN